MPWRLLKAKVCWLLGIQVIHRIQMLHLFWPLCNKLRHRGIVLEESRVDLSVEVRSTRRMLVLMR